MRKPFVAGNWKMNKTVDGARHLVSEMIPGLQSIDGVDMALCPPATALLTVAALLEGTEIGLGAQNMHWEASGAFTGEISPLMVAELCDYVILGHSERRAYFGETNETVNHKVKAALEHGLTPIVCVGETLDENEAGVTADIVSRQVRQGLAGMEDAFSGADALVVAYEPVWAIGTGRAATVADASTVIGGVIRPALAGMFGGAFAGGVRVLYGGSVKGNNAAEFFAAVEIDGALVGGASLEALDFIQIVRAAR